MRNEENVGHNARGEHVFFSLLLIDEISIVIYHLSMERKNACKLVINQLQ